MGTHFHEYTSITVARALAARAVLGLTAMTLGLCLMAPEQARAQTYSVLHSFQCAPDDGAYPDGGLTLDTNGNLYGTTFNGGPYDSGTVFEATPAGAAGGASPQLAALSGTGVE
jgi:uncharacterized repeat protein (TIGR03803 family)